MGLYLGQLPQAEIARLKAELAETLIANFCYPRFFDNRVEALRMRPVDRAKRQEVWLFLSAVDFTSWSRIDLTTPDLQHHIERLFIQFVQRNRAFFGQQGRKRMSDVRMLINSSAASVVQAMRGHLSGQRQGNSSFGSPRPAVSWSQANGRSEPGWEKIASATMTLQQQLQEWRGEVRPAASNGTSSNGAGRPATQQQPMKASAGTSTHDGMTIAQSPTPIPPSRSSATRNPAPPLSPAATAAAPTQPPAPETAAHKQESAPASPNERTAMPPAAKAPGEAPASGPLASPTKRNDAPPAARDARRDHSLPSAETVQSPAVKPVSPVPVASTASVQTRNTLPAATSAPSFSASVAPSARESTMMSVGEDDIAIFEQLRHQMLIWLRVEAIRAGLDISSHLATAQLLDMLRQHVDDTRLQVVSTLLNLSNQVIKTGTITVLDYKQALMFHLMHTRR